MIEEELKVTRIFVLSRPRTVISRHDVKVWALEHIKDSRCVGESRTRKTGSHEAGTEKTLTGLLERLHICRVGARRGMLSTLLVGVFRPLCQRGTGTMG